MPVRREGNEGQVHTVQHQFDRHEDGDDVALNEESADTAGKEDAAQHEIVRNWDHLVLHLLCGSAAGDRWLAGKDHGTHDGDQDQDRSNFKRQQELVEKQLANDIGCARQSSNGNFACTGVLQYDPRNQETAQQHPGNAEQDCDSAAFGLFFYPGIEKHDDEDEENHNGAGVDDDLHGGDKLRAQQHVFAREGGHDRDQRQGGIDRMSLHQQVNGARGGYGSESQEQD